MAEFLQTAQFGGKREFFPEGVLSDSLGLFWVSHPGGGLMNILVSTRGGPWEKKVVLNGMSGEPTGHFTNLNVELDLHRIRIEGVSGTNFIIGPHILNSQSHGVHAVFMDAPGISLEDISKVPLAIRKPILEGVSPDLLIWHMKEYGPELIRSGLEENEKWWNDAAPSMPALYIATPYTALDKTSEAPTIT